MVQLYHMKSIEYWRGEICHRDVQKSEDRTPGIVHWWIIVVDLSARRIWAAGRRGKIWRNIFHRNTLILGTRVLSRLRKSVGIMSSMWKTASGQLGSWICGALEQNTLSIAFMCVSVWLHDRSWSFCFVKISKYIYCKCLWQSVTDWERYNVLYSSALWCLYADTVLGLLQNRSAPVEGCSIRKKFQRVLLVWTSWDQMGEDGICREYGAGVHDACSRGWDTRI